MRELREDYAKKNKPHLVTYKETILLNLWTFSG